MNIKPVSFIIVTCIVVLSQFCRASANNNGDSVRKDSALQIYLPREVTIEDDSLKLGRVSIIRGEESLVAKASEIMLGRFSLPGQRIVLGRSVVLSRLACNGISASQVALTGSEEITVKKQHKVIKGSEFVELAASFLKKSLSDGLVCQAKPVRMPKDLFLPMSYKDVTLSPHLIEGAVPNQAKVRVSVLAPDQVGSSNEIGVAIVTFRLKFKCRRVVTLTEIPAGAVIGPENVKIERIVTDYPEAANWSPPYGLIARRRLPANTVIQPNMLGSIKPVRRGGAIKRNDTVVIRVEMPGLIVTALGKAMQQGYAGECIKVRNIDSQRIIVAKINEDRTVQPIF